MRNTSFDHGIPFTQYLLPNGRTRPQWIKLDPEIETIARRFVSAGGWYECEMLSDMEHVSFTACWDCEDGDNDIAIRIAENGPAVPQAVEEIVRASGRHLESRSGPPDPVPSPMRD